MNRTRLVFLLPLVAAAAVVLNCGGSDSKPIVGAATSAPSGATTPAATKAPSGSPTPAATPTPSSQIKVTSASVNETADHYTIKLTYPQTGIAAADAQIKKIVDNAVTEIKDAANQSSKPGAPTSAAGKYTLDGSFDTIQAGPDIVSLRFGISTYTGGAHGGHVIYGLNFDKTGKALTLDDVLKMTRLNLQQLSDQSKAALQAKLTRDFIFPDGADPDPKNFDTFLIGPDKVTFVFQEYQVAPYSAGISEISFPRS